MKQISWTCPSTGRTVHGVPMPKARAEALVAYYAAKNPAIRYWVSGS